MKTIKIARIGGEGEVLDYINPYTGKPSNTWREFDEAKLLFDSLDFSNISKQEGGYSPEYRKTKKQMEAEIAFHFEDGYKPYLNLFSFEIPLDIWVNREQYSKEREITIPTKILEKYLVNQI